MSKNILTKKVMVIGSSGQLAMSLKEIVDLNIYQFFSRIDLDARNGSQVTNKINEFAPNLIINCSAYTDVEKAESDEQAAYDLNVNAVRNLAQICRSRNIPLIHISTDYVFDGTKRGPYVESDQLNPISVYGRSKAEGELEIVKTSPNFVIIRTSWLFSKYGTNFVSKMIDLAKTKQELQVISDQIGCPTSAHNLAKVLEKISKKILKDGNNFPFGIYHYTDNYPCTWVKFAQEIFDILQKKHNLSVPKIVGVTTLDYNTKAKRPLNSLLTCQLIQQKLGIKQYDSLASLGECVEHIVNANGF